MNRVVDDMMNTAKNQGASQRAADTIVYGSVAIVVLLSLTIGFVVIYDTFTVTVLPIWAISIMTAIGFILTTIITTSHATNNAVTVQKSTVAEQQAISIPVVTAAAQATIINAQTMQSVLKSMTDTNQIHAISSADTIGSAEKVLTTASDSATIANTNATIENTATLAGIVPVVPTVVPVVPVVPSEKRG